MKSFFIVLAVALSSKLSAQNFPESERIKLIQSKGIEISNIDLKNLSDNDFELIKDFNFDNFRNEKTDRQIQIVRGPLAKIKSFNYCKENHIDFDEKVFDIKKSEIELNSNYSLITQVNIGFGIIQNDKNLEKY